MLTSPFLAALAPATRVLIAGVGGGYDVFSGLPLFFGLRADGKEVHLANLSFSVLPPDPPARLTPALLRVTATTGAQTGYFPEKYLAQWFQSRGEDVPVWCFERTGVRPLLEAYRTLTTHLRIDALVLVDGGTDSLMRGDEAGLGTPQEDIASLTAARELDIPTKLLACLGFGVDHYHGVCHAHFLEAVAELTRERAYLGTVALLEDMPEVQLYRAATESVFRQMPHAISIVSSSILSALAGHYGDVHATERTRGSTLWINPLMSTYWCFQADAVARRVLYREAMLATESYRDVSQVIDEFRLSCEVIRRASRIPL